VTQGHMPLGDNTEYTIHNTDGISRSTSQLHSIVSAEPPFHLVGHSSEFGSISGYGSVISHDFPEFDKTTVNVRI
jgi:hypothetical protein